MHIFSIIPQKGGFLMGKQCYICEKTTTFGNKVSHSKRKTRKKQKPNLHNIKIEVNNKVKKVYVCSKCLKANKVKKVV
jgi:large subunit ribosomal protein L28